MIFEFTEFKPLLYFKLVFQYFYMKIRSMSVQRIATFILILFISVSCTDEKIEDGRRSDCNSPKSVNSSSEMFSKLHSENTRILFENTLIDSADINPLSFLYAYNGAGVASADFNKDGLQDLFFCGNQTDSKLYLNLGGFKFSDITDTSGILTEGGWNMGCNIVDINNDGWDDIYISRAVAGNLTDSKNRLYINNGDLTFVEKAASYGLDDPGNSVQTIFFDKDRDRDLDAFVLNFPSDFLQIANISYLLSDLVDTVNSNRLYENNDQVFQDITETSGIGLDKGFSLSAAIEDFNHDGYSDIYVANDFFSLDRLYIYDPELNKYSDQLESYFPNVPLQTMGISISDLDNDLQNEIMMLEMHPITHFRQKNKFQDISLDFYLGQDRIFKTGQFTRNFLYHGDQNGFADVAHFSGLAHTDWSWSVLMHDLDNDGLKDIIITNGLARDFSDQDYMNSISNENYENVKNFNKEMGDFVNHMPKSKVPNLVYKNNGSMQFESANEMWSFNDSSSSQGAIVSDLNNDGFLDVVFNNTNSTPSIFMNNGRELNKNNYLDIELTGSINNINAIGSRITLYAQDEVQTRLLSGGESYLSCSTPLVHFGLSNKRKVDSLRIQWNETEFTKLIDPGINRILKISKEDTEIFVSGSGKVMPEVRTIVEAVDFLASETDFSDFKRERLIPRAISKEGPATNAADLNGDGLEDFVIGGPFGTVPAIYLQDRSGAFTSQLLHEVGMNHEITGIVLFDSDGDDDMDILFTCSSNELSSDLDLSDVLLVNDGNGSFEVSRKFDELSTGVATPIDVDSDGDLDLFIAGRHVPGAYGIEPEAFFLMNDKGDFTVNNDIESFIGMVTDALATDVDLDGDSDLIIVGEFMPITLLINSEGAFSTVEIDQSGGWWNCIENGDIDGDGDMDYLIGNYGRNSVYKASVDSPMKLYVSDFDSNSMTEALLFYALEDGYGSKPSRDQFCSQMPEFNNQFPDNYTYSTADWSGFFKTVPNEIDTLFVHTLNSSILRNEGNGSYTLEPLPEYAQFTPINDLILNDINKDGHLDYVAAGNTNSNYYTDGNILVKALSVCIGDGKGNFSEAPELTNGVSNHLVINSCVLYRSSGDKDNLLLGVNNGNVISMKLN